MRALVTGGSGFIGSYVVQELESKGWEVVIGDVDSKFDFENNAEIENMDICNYSTCFNIISNVNPDCIFHCAGLLGTSTLFSTIKEAEQVNVGGTLNILDILREIDSDCVIVQPNLLGDWLNPYMQTKQQAERYGFMYKKNFGLKYTSVRPTDVYGARQHWRQDKAAPVFMMKALKGEKIPIYGHGKSWVNYVHGRDVAKFLVQCYESNAWEHNGSIDFSDPVGDTTILEFAKKINTLAGMNSEIVHFQMRSGQPGETNPIPRDLSYAEEIFDFQQLTPIDDGIKETLWWYKGLIPSVV